MQTSGSNDDEEEEKKELWKFSTTMDESCLVKQEHHSSIQCVLHIITTLVDFLKEIIRQDKEKKDYGLGEFTLKR